MNLLEMLRTTWRHRVAVLPVVLLTAVGMVYVTAFAPATYQLTASYVLIPPPGPPSEAELDEDPSLADVSDENPFLRFPGQSVIVDLLARRVDADVNRQALVAAGADERFTIAPSNRFGFSSPIVDIEATSDTDAGALETAELVSTSMEEQLTAMQEEHNVHPRYMFEPLLVSFPTRADRMVTGTMRAAIAVGAAGGLMTFMVVSVAEALRQWRQQDRPKDTARGRRARGVHAAGSDDGDDEWDMELLEGMDERAASRW